MNLAAELEKLDRLRQSGALSEEEYAEAKAQLLSRDRPVGQKLKDTIDGIAPDENSWGMLIHLSQFCGYAIPMAGLIVPIILWQIKKDESATIDRHGRIVVNWIITEFIYAMVFGLLSMVLIGIPLFFALCIAGIVFPIVGGIKAKDGEIWRYPCSIDFFRLD